MCCVGCGNESEKKCLRRHKFLEKETAKGEINRTQYGKGNAKCFTNSLYHTMAAGRTADMTVKS